MSDRLNTIFFATNARIKQEYLIAIICASGQRLLTFAEAKGNINC